jgi:oligosaccharide amylase
MPRDIPVCNGRLLVTFDQAYQIRDLYFPNVGSENHTQGYPCRFGVWADGVFSWVADGSWSVALGYVDESLVSRVVLKSERLQLELLCNDTVDFHENIYLRRVAVRDLAGRPRNVRLFFHQDFRINETDVGDTAYYDPENLALVHYKSNRYFLAGVLAGDSPGPDEYATGRKGGTSEGTWRDAEDGSLQGNSIAQGAVDSTLMKALAIEPAGYAVAYYWIAAGRSHHEITVLNNAVRVRTAETLIKRTEDFWRAWVNKSEISFGNLPNRLIDLYKRSLLILRTQVNENGAIIAANDSDISQFSRDTYSYMWPRDGALVAYALDIGGHSELTRRFFFFMKDLIRKEGYFLHKYTPEGEPASSWHPWYAHGERQLPIQEDETALVLWALWQHYNRHRDLEFIKRVYRPLIKVAADFMVRYRDANGFPKPSWDLWEERRGIHAFTCATVNAGLRAAARFAALFGEDDLRETYAGAAAAIKQAMVRYMYMEGEGRFARTLTPDGNGGYIVDSTIDASLYGVWYFRTFKKDDPKVVSTMQAVEERLWARTDVGGLARYENDYYHQVSKDLDSVPGNPWFICTLWIAQYRVARAETLEELEESLPILEWVSAHALPSGVLAEQVDPFTNAPLSVSPLTWSHATVVATVIEYLRKLEELVVCESCGRPLFLHDRKLRDASKRMTGRLNTGELLAGDD